MDLSEELVVKFYAGHCNNIEASIVQAWLKANPAYIQQRFLPEWNSDDSSILFAEASSIELTEAESAEILADIQLQIDAYKRHKKLHRIMPYAIAASMLLCVLTGWWLTTSNVAKAKNNFAIVQKPANILQWTTHTNSTASQQIIELPDGTTVTLYQGGSLKYNNQYNTVDRQLYLENNAFFAVKKDASKPLIVYTDQVATQALGTSFNIQSNQHSVKVQLYTGKVSISKKVQGHWVSAAVLLPNEEITFDYATQKMRVGNFKTMPNKVQKDSIVKNIETSNWNKNVLEFESTPLVQVIQLLEKRSGQTISYNKEEIEGKYFTGKVLASDSTFLILRAIAQMNQLKITETAEGYSLKKLP